MRVIALLLTMLIAGATRGDPIDATCKVEGAGTGCVFDIDSENVWVLTCRHVVGGSTAVNLRFYRQGHQASRAVRGVVAKRGRRTDSAVVRVPAEMFLGHIPPAIPAGSVGGLNKGDTIITVGCYGQAWPTLFRGHVTGVRKHTDRSQAMLFVPPPMNGRSGSAIFNEAGTRIIGVLYARDDNSHEGLAEPIDFVLTDLYSQSRYSSKAPLKLPLVPVQKKSTPYMPIVGENGWRQSQCPPGQCPPRYGTYEDDSDRGLFGNRGGLFPNLPRRQQPEVPPYPSQDEFEALQRKLDQAYKNLDGLMQRLEYEQENGDKPDTDAWESRYEQLKKLLEQNGRQADGELAELQSRLDELKARLEQDKADPGAVTDTLKGAATSQWLWSAIAVAIAAVLPFGRWLVFFLRPAVSWVGPMIGRAFIDAITGRINDPNDTDMDTAIEKAGRLAANGTKRRRPARRKSK